MFQTPCSIPRRGSIDMCPVFELIYMYIDTHTFTYCVSKLVDIPVIFYKRSIDMRPTHIHTHTHTHTHT